MADALLVLSLIIGVVTLALAWLLLRRTGSVSDVEGGLDGIRLAQEGAAEAIRQEFARGRSEAADSARQVREEVGSSGRAMLESTVRGLADLGGEQAKRLNEFAAGLARMTESANESGRLLRQEIATSVQVLAEAVQNQSSQAAKAQSERLDSAAKLQKDQLEAFAGQLRLLSESTATQQSALRESMENRLKAMQESNEQKIESLRTVMDAKLTEMQADNSKRLDEMRATVDEKLQGTLEKRLGESFKLVSDRLEQVHKGLGEMQSLASGVGDLKRVLTNVKTRGTWGEVQLGNLLDQMLTPEQYAANVATKPESGERVEFAIRLPGKSDAMDRPVWLPIDSKCPQEDYLRIMEAADRGDAEGVRESSKQLENRIKSCGKDISAKYISPPDTTDFGILFVPTEGLYAEVLRCPGLTEFLQRECRVMVAGPTTLAALLNSLQMGFRTLAIEKRSSEVWSVLSAVKTEFGKFGDVLDKVQRKLGEAQNTIEAAAVRTRAMDRKLRGVDELPTSDAAKLLGLPVAGLDGASESEDSV